MVEWDGEVVGTFRDGGSIVGPALSAFHRQCLTMLIQAERRERQEGMFMPQAALAHFMAVMRQDVTRVTLLSDADCPGVHVRIFQYARNAEENGSRTSASAHVYLQTADVNEARGRD